MHTFYLKIDGINGDVADAPYRDWHKISSYVITDDPETDPDRQIGWTGCFHYIFIDPDHADLQYLNVNLPTSARVSQLFSLWQTRGTLPVDPANTTLEGVTEGGVKCLVAKFEDVRITEIVLSPARTTGKDSVAFISLKFKSANLPLKSLRDVRRTR